MIPFDTRSQKLAESLTSQAAVALNNFNLVKETEYLFESFLAVMATGLDARSKYTSGHVRRVAGLTMELAKALNETTDGAYHDRLFSDDDMSELRIAAWMHDIGKIVSPTPYHGQVGKIRDYIRQVSSGKHTLSIAQGIGGKKRLTEKTGAQREGSR